MADDTLLDYALSFYNNDCCLQLGGGISIQLQATVPPGQTVEVQEIKVSMLFGESAVALGPRPPGDYFVFGPSALSSSNCPLTFGEDGSTTVRTNGVPATSSAPYLLLEGIFSINEALGTTTITVTETTVQGGVRSTVFALNKYPAGTGLGLLEFHQGSAAGTVVTQPIAYGSDIWLTWTAQGSLSLKLLSGSGIDEAELTGDTSHHLGRVTEPSTTASVLVSLTDAVGKPRHYIEATTLAVEPLGLQAKVGTEHVTLTWAAAADAPMSLSWSGAASPVDVTGKSSYQLPLSALTQSPTTFRLRCTAAPAALASSAQEVQVFLERSLAAPTVSLFDITDADSTRADGTYLLTPDKAYNLAWSLTGADQAAAIRIQPPLGKAISVTPTAGSDGAAATLPTSTSFTPAAMEGPLTLSVLDAQGAVLTTTALTVLCQAPAAAPPTVTHFKVTNPDSTRADGTYLLIPGTKYELTWYLSASAQVASISIQPPLGKAIEPRRTPGSATLPTSCTSTFSPMQGPMTLFALDAQGAVLATATLTLLCQARISNFGVKDPDTRDNDGSYALTTGNSYELDWTCLGARPTDQFELLLPLGAPTQVFASPWWDGSANCSVTPSAAMQGLASLRLLDAQGALVAESAPISLVVTDSTDSHLIYSLSTYPSPIRTSSPVAITVRVQQATKTSVFAQRFFVHVPVMANATGLVEGLEDTSTHVQVGGNETDAWVCKLDQGLSGVIVTPKGGGMVKMPAKAPLEITITGLKVNAYDGVALLRLTGAISPNDKGSTLLTSVMFQLNKVPPTYAITNFRSDKQFYDVGETIQLSWSRTENIGRLRLCWESETAGPCSKDVSNLSRLSVTNDRLMGNTVFTLVGDYTARAQSQIATNQVTVSTTPVVTDFHATPAICGYEDNVTLSWNVIQPLATCSLVYANYQGEQQATLPADWSKTGAQSTTVINPKKAGTTVFTLQAQPQNGGQMRQYQTSIITKGLLTPLISDFKVTGGCTGNISFSWKTNGSNPTVSLRWMNSAGQQTIDINTGTSQQQVDADRFDFGDKVVVSLIAKASEAGELPSTTLTRTVHREPVLNFSWCGNGVSWGLCGTGIRLELAITDNWGNTSQDVTGETYYAYNVRIGEKITVNFLLTASFKNAAGKTDTRTYKTYYQWPPYDV